MQGPTFSIPWAPPEAVGRGVYTAAAAHDAWSLGVLLFEVLDGPGQPFNPEALELRLFEGSIPADRVSTRSTTLAEDGVYSLALNSLEVQAETTYLLSVRCGDIDRRRFRVIVFEIPSCCPGCWTGLHYVLH